MNKKNNCKVAEFRREEKQIDMRDLAGNTALILMWAKEDGLPYLGMADDGSFCKFNPDGTIEVEFDRFEVWEMNHGHYQSQKEV